MQVLANGRKAVLLDQLLPYLNTTFMGLFVNNVTPTGATIIGDLTECTDSGYAATGRQAPVFASSTLNGSNQGQSIAPALTWTFSHSPGDFTVYGYFLATLISGGVLVLSERAASPFTCTASGQTYTVNPKELLDTLA